MIHQSRFTRFPAPPKTSLMMPALMTSAGRFNPSAIGLIGFVGMFSSLAVTVAIADDQARQRPNVILVMADDMGWGQTGYQNHPVLKTPNLDAMAENGI